MFKHILVPLDGSRLAECVIPHAVSVAKAFESRITLLQVLERVESTNLTRSVDPLGWHIRKAEASAYLESMTGRLQKTGLRAENELLEGKTVEQITEFMQTHGVELIVLSSHGRSGLSGWNISSVVQKILLSAYMPALIVRAYQPAASEMDDLRYARVLVPLDGSRRAECVLPMVTSLARAQGSNLLLAHLVCRPEMPRRAPLTDEEASLVERLTECNRKEAVRYFKQLQSQLEADVETRLVVVDDAAAAIHDLVEEEQVSLVVLSAHGYSGRTRWPYGRIALSFIAYGTTPLLIMQDLSREQAQKSMAELAAAEYKGH